MTKIALVVVPLMLFVVPAMADHPAVGYWFVEVGRLTNEVSRVGSVADVDESSLDEIAECRGYFKGTCDLWIHARTVQIRFKAADDGKEIDYSFTLSWPPVKRQPVESHGRLTVGEEYSAKEGWSGEKWVLVFKRLNLKK